jgi:hypothetical protein
MTKPGSFGEFLADAPPGTPPAEALQNYTRVLAGFRQAVAEEAGLDPGILGIGPAPDVVVGAESSVADVAVGDSAASDR